jgi:hypothetical protein
VASAVASLLRLASIVICLIVLASFATFAVQQTKSASGEQREAVASGTASAPVKVDTSRQHKGAVHKALDEASDELTSPFAGIVSGTSSEWTIRGVKLLLALLVYGFALGYLARIIRVRA